MLKIKKEKKEQNKQKVFHDEKRKFCQEGHNDPIEERRAGAV